MVPKGSSKGPAGIPMANPGGSLRNLCTSLVYVADGLGQTPYPAGHYCWEIGGKGFGQSGRDPPAVPPPQPWTSQPASTTAGLLKRRVHTFNYQIQINTTIWEYGQNKANGWMILPQFDHFCLILIFFDAFSWYLQSRPAE